MLNAELDKDIFLNLVHIILPRVHTLRKAAPVSLVAICSFFDRVAGGFLCST